jgi:hypothetical protein
MTTSELLAALGWSPELVAEYEKAQCLLNASAAVLPPLPVEDDEHTLTSGQAFFVRPETVTGDKFIYMRADQ